MILRILITALKIFLKWRAGRSVWMRFTSMTGEMIQLIVITALTVVSPTFTPTHSGSWMR